MEKLEFPKIGLRTLKTALAVFLCMILFQITGRGSAFFACIATVICMKDTVEGSYSIGKNRLFGTLLGGIIGVIIIKLLAMLPYSENIKPVITSLGVIAVIYACNIVKKPASINIACIVLLGIMCSYGPDDSYYYAINRMFDTAIGVIVSIIINQYITPPKK